METTTPPTVDQALAMIEDIQTRMDGIVTKLTAQLEAANARAEVFRLAIIEAEWSSAEGADSCPWCRWDFGHSHEADCPVTLARKT